MRDSIPVFLTAAMTLLLLFSGQCFGEEVDHEFDIKPQSLESALTLFSKITDYQFIYTNAEIAALKTVGVKGHYSSDAALRNLLKGTDVLFKYTNENTILLYLENLIKRGGELPEVALAHGDTGGGGGAEVPLVSGLKKDTQSSSHTAGDVRPERNVIDEIIVTALKRESNLQDTPVALSVLTGKSLERIGADDFIDFIGAVPGLNVRDNGPGQTRPIIRGIFSPGEPQVGVYIDEAIITGAPGTTNSAGRFSAELKPFDIERIEILKGPQGTLYGGGSMGGAIRFITNKPNVSRFEGKLSIEGSRVRHGGAGYQVNGMVNLPVIEDQLALRLVAYKRDDPGFVDNVTLFRDNINNVDTEGGRIALRWMPNDHFMATGAVFYQNQKVGGGFHFNPGLGSHSPKTDVGSNEPFDDEYVLYNMTLEYGFNRAGLLYSFTYYDRNAVFRFHNGFTGNPFPPLLSVQPQPARAQTHEVRLTSKGENVFDWTIGAYYQDRVSFADSRVTQPAASGDEPDPAVFFFRRTVESSLIQRAVFGEFTWHFTGKLSLTAGFRYFDIDNGSDVVNIFGPFNAPVIPRRINVTRGADNGPVFKLHAGYHLTDDILFYTQFSQGYRPGGANQNRSSIAITAPLNAGVPESFKSDSVDNYELGFHTTLFDERVRFNGAIFHIDWSDIVLEQRSPTGLFGFLNNADSADVDGFELELMAAPVPELKITTALTYLDAELSSDGPANRQRVAGNTLSRSGLDGDAIPNVPSWTFNASLEYGYALPWYGLQGIVYLNVDYTGESFSDYNAFLLDPTGLSMTSTPNDAYNRQGDYIITDIRLGLESEGNWGAYLFVENIFDKRGITHVFEDVTFRPAPGLHFFERPRTISLVLNKEF